MGDSIRAALRSLEISRPFPEDYRRDAATMARELEGLILSASGWRKVFASTAEDADAAMTETNGEIVAVAGAVFSRFLRTKKGSDIPTVVLATDSRPTGPAIAAILARVLVSEGVGIRYLGIAAAPEVMAYVRTATLDGFVYVSASHNPIGHNGLKFGLSDGSVIGGTEAQSLIAAFNDLIRDEAASRSVIRSLQAVEGTRLAELNEDAPRWKQEALDSYLSFDLEVGTMAADPADRERALTALRTKATRAGLGIVADFNGSARCVSIDRRFLEELGVRLVGINDRPGEIVHTIVPEGEALEPCRRQIEALHRRDNGFLLGYVPDNDGDRGNLVYVDRRTGRAEILRAQEVFALSCMAELAYLVYTGSLTYGENGRAQQRHAVVVNGPTSLRIDAIAKAFDVAVFRSEVGEANVVNLARDSRNSGFQVRFMGEGSNGGNITHPAAVRDPLNTISAFLKLLLIDSEGGKPGLYEIWCARSGQEFTSGAGIGDMLRSLPPFTTTDVNDARAVVDIRTTDHARLKEAYEEVFLHEWDANKERLAGELGIHTWEEINYEGMNEIHGFGRTYRSGKQRGGLKILFKDDQGRKIAFIWMRGSGTEPVFRVLADTEGSDPEVERRLLEWHVDMIRRADARIGEPVGARH